MSIIKKKDLTLLEQTYLPQIVKGLGLTFKQMFRPKFTRQYPEEKWIPPGSGRRRVRKMCSMRIMLTSMSGTCY